MRRLHSWLRPLALLTSLVLIGSVVSVPPTGASTQTQVDQGLQVFQSTCETCHGANLEGAQGPPLKTDAFRRDWADFNKLRAFIQKEMPPPNGGILTTEQAVNVAHFLYSRNGVEPDGFAYPAFRQLWTIADQPVAAQQAQRSWLWGPEGFAVAWEDYVEAPGGKRLVQYFDKTRMEITRIDNPSDQSGYVTNGLLATELVSGRLQRGDNTFELRAPAQVNVAGDPDDAEGPTYATFTRLTGRVEARGGTITDLISRAGGISDNPALAGRAMYGNYVPETGHNIASVFWDFLNSNGPTIRNNRVVSGRIFDPWWAPVGLPITEPYWARVKVGGQVKDVLVQCFERRCLTFTPENRDGFKVEMGNVGRHYHTWRYAR